MKLLSVRENKGDMFEKIPLTMAKGNIKFNVEMPIDYVTSGNELFMLQQIIQNLQPIRPFNTSFLHKNKMLWKASFLSRQSIRYANFLSNGIIFEYSALQNVQFSN